MILGFLKGFQVNGSRKQTNFEDKIKEGIKKHTIRDDSKNRWQAGRKIHFANGVRTSKYNNFKMGVCKSVQEIHIVDRMVFIDQRKLSLDEIDGLAINDGFDNTSDFWSWFDDYTPFLGKLIHWTDLKY